MRRGEGTGRGGFGVVVELGRLGAGDGAGGEG